MNRPVTLCLIVFLVCSVDVIFAQNRDVKWKSIFNGKNLKGWLVKTKPEDSHKKYWNVVDGCIVANSMGDSIHDYMWLLSKNEYSEFEMKFRFKVCRGMKGNSGLQILSRYDDSKGWLDGPQIDINPVAPFRCGMMWDETRDVRHWIYPWIDRGKGWVKPGQEINPVKIHYYDEDAQWNDVVVRVNDSHITCYMNEVLITDYDGKGFLDDSIHQKYQVGTKGHIALQIHIHDQVNISFKDLYVRKL